MLADMSPPAGHERGSSRAPASSHVRWSYPTALAVAASAYVLLHHLGLVPGGLGRAAEGTRKADWLDLLTPYMVLAPAAATLHAASATGRQWACLALGAVMYASGHGIHLAANSIGNVSPGPTAHLWDEVVGHYVWYAGVALVTAAVAATMTGRKRPHNPGSYVLAVAVGLTWATNGIGAGTALLSLLLALVAVGFGWRHRYELTVLLVIAYIPASLLLTADLVTQLA